MRRVIIFLVILIVLGVAAMTVYAYVADLSAPTRPMEAPAVGVGFGE